MFSLGIRKDRLKNPSKQYRAPCACRLKKGEGRKKYLFSKIKKRGKKKILCDIESLKALTPQICQTGRVLRGNDQPIQRSEGSTV